MRQTWIVATLVALLGAAPSAYAQTAKDNLDKLKKSEKDSKTPEEIEKARVKAQEEKAAAAKAKADADKAKADADKAKADADKAKADADKAKADADKAAKDKVDADKAAKDKADANKDKAKADKDKDKAEEADDKDAPAALVQLRTTRDDRRKASIEKLKARWGELVSNENARSELERHAKFVANLQRIRSLAEEKKKVKLIEKIDQLLTKEELRHASQMNKLRDAVPAAPVAGGAK